MPRYYFHIAVEGDRIADPDGEDLPDADAAWDRARASAQALMQADLGRPVEWLRCHIEVTDADGEVVLEFPFAEAIDVKSQGH